MKMPTSGKYNYKVCSLFSDIAGFPRLRNSLLSCHQLINMLANEGFTIDKIAAMGETNCVVIMSKNSSGDSSIITKSADEHSTNAVEIARYDLQGRLVDDDCPGLQIVVYSDYSAKIVVVK